MPSSDDKHGRRVNQWVRDYKPAIAGYGVLGLSFVYDYIRAGDPLATSPVGGLLTILGLALLAYAFYDYWNTSDTPADIYD